MAKSKKKAQKKSTKKRPKPAKVPPLVTAAEIHHHRHIQGRLIYLLLSLLTLLIFYPFLDGLLLGNEFLIFMATIIPISGVYALSNDKVHISGSFFLAMPFISFNWLQAISPIPPFVYLNMIFSILFYGYTSYVLLKYFLNAKDIHTDIIFGAISVYIMIGMIFSALFVAIEVAEPGSFALSATADANHVPGALQWDDSLYYSIITLTNTGYGDVTPVAPLARSLSMIEAVVGVFYVAILISQLMGIYVIKRARSFRKKKE